uniref:Vacuolar sorting protein (Vps16 homologue), putative n=1 Tax=Theileria annulata TaxID=5874 RepID=A0A3B0N898_THEAN
MENWCQLGDKNIRREVWPTSQINSAPEDIKAVAPLGTMLAIVSGDSKNLNTDEENVKCVLRIYNGSCVLVTSVKWYVSFENILGIQWTDSLELVSVFTNGCVRVYSAHGELLRTFYLHSYGESNNNRIDQELIKYKIWSNGLVFVNFADQRLYFQKGFETQNTWVVELNEYALSVTALGVVANRSWNQVLVIFSTLNGTNFIKMDHLMKCTNFEDFQKCLLQVNPCTYTHISSSPYHFSHTNLSTCDFEDLKEEQDVNSNINKKVKSNKYFIGMGNNEEGLLTSLCIDDRGVKILWEIKIEPFNNIYTMSEGILAVTFTTKTDNLSNDPKSPNNPPILENESNENDNTEQLLRRDRESNLIKLIYNADYDLNIYTQVVEILSDIGGGLRVFTRSKMEYLDIVSISSELALSPDRCDVTNSLLRTYEMFKNGDEKSSESLYSIRDKLLRASKVCLEASKDQWNFETALLLIEFSIFSSSMNSLNDSTTKNNNNSEEDSVSDQKFKNIELARENESKGDRGHILIICYLRVCKNLVEYNIYTNINQLMLFGLKRLIVLLTSLKLYLLSIRICEFFRISPVLVLIGWITTRIKLGTHLTDSELFSIISNRLDKYLGTVLSFSKVAQVVFKQGRDVLALSFIEREKCPYKQFKVLIKWNELSRAAKVANECGDPTLINFIILKTFNNNDISNIITLSNEYTLIKNMFVHQLLLSGNDKVLQVFYERTNSVFEAGLNSINIYNRNNPFLSNREGEPDGKDKRDDLNRERKYSLNYSNGYFGNKTNTDAAFWHEAVNNEMLLLEHQITLENTHESLKSIKLVGRSLMETIYELYKLNLTKEVEVLVNAFKLPINQIRCAKIAAYHKTHNVQELFNLIQDKQFSSVYIKPNFTYFHLLLQTLISLGANTHVDTIIHNMKPSQHNYWRNFVNQFNKN